MTDVSSATDARAQRGEVTRRRLLDVGVRVFGARGYDAVSTRELATAAHANQAAILYHFGGKEGLYLAAAAHVAALARASMGIAATEGMADGAAPLTRDVAARVLGDLLGRMLRGFLDLADDGAAARFVVREQTQPGPAFDVLYDGYVRHVHERVTSLVAVITERPASAASTVIDAHAVIGMALGFAVARETFLRRARWTGYSPAHVDAVAASVTARALRALGAPESPAALAAPQSRRRSR